jgi:hypothetical protein
MSEPKNSDIAVPEAERPWERMGVVRRDADPDRGLLLCVLGLVALVLAPLGGVVLGAVVWRLANNDIQKMHAGRMHRSAMWDAKHARQCALGAVVSAALVYAVLGGLLVWRFLFGP